MSLVIAAAQSASEPGDVARNVAHHLHIATLAAGQGVQFLVFPELSLTGYELGLARASLVDPAEAVLDPLREIASRAGMTVVAGAPVGDDAGGLHIAALAFCPDGSLVIHAKEHVHESEQHVFTCGAGGPPLAAGGMRVALAICADASHPSHAAKAAAHGAGVYAVSAMIGDDAYERKSALLQRFAREYRMMVLLANYSGSTGGERSAGKSAIWSANGMVAGTSGTEETLVIARVEQLASS